MNRHGQRGVGLIELMVSLALSLFLLAVIVTLYQSLRVGQNFQQTQSDLHERERLLAGLLTNVIQTAGYRPDAAATAKTVAFPGAAASGMHAAYASPQVIAGIDGGGASDRLSLRFVTAHGDGMLDCLGWRNTAGAVRQVSNTFYVLDDRLRCAQTVTGGATPITDDQVLLDRVSNLEVSYGVDGDGNGWVDRYATTLTGAQIDRVRSVRLTLGLQTLDNQTRVLMHAIDLPNEITRR